MSEPEKAAHLPTLPPKAAPPSPQHRTGEHSTASGDRRALENREIKKAIEAAIARNAQGSPRVLTSQEQIQAEAIRKALGSAATGTPKPGAGKGGGDDAGMGYERSPDYTDKKRRARPSGMDFER